MSPQPGATKCLARAIDLLKQSLGVGAPRSNGLGRLAGEWSDERARDFERVLAPFGEIDPEMWR